MKSKKFLKKWFCMVLLFLVFVYLLGGILIFIFQKDLVYYPSKQDFYNCEGFSETERLDVNGTRIYFKKNNSDKIFIFYHGNAGSACDRSYWKKYLESLEYSYAIVEYSGYSDDNREPNKNLILNDVKNVVNFIDDYGFKKILLAGESLGTSLATYHSILMKVDKLLLISPFYSLNSLAKKSFFIYPISWISTENFNSAEWIKKTKSESIEIVHGLSDKTIPIDEAERLFSEITLANKEFIKVPGADHNDIYSFEETEKVIKKFLE